MRSSSRWLWIGGRGGAGGERGRIELIWDGICGRTGRRWNPRIRIPVGHVERGGGPGT